MAVRRPRGILSRTRTMFLVLLFGLLALSLKPFAPLERALDLAFVPTRVLVELASPLGWLRAAEVRAAERELFASDAAARERAERVLAAEQRAALPSRPELCAGRRRVHGEVVRRGREGLDRVIVRLATTDGVEPGMPVTAGDVFVGRVARVEPGAAREVTVDLVTAADFFVGAVQEEPEPAGHEPCRAVVGGLAPRAQGERAIHLALHNPSRRPALGARVVVREPDLPGLLEADRWSKLADGFELGTVAALDVGGQSELLRLRPRLDYEAGLSQVVVLAGAARGAPAQELAIDTFERANWLAARALTAGDVTAARSGRRISAGALHGVRAGAAVAFGSRLIGVVAHAGWVASDVQHLDDAGLRLAALARFDGDAPPRAVGEIVSTGRRRADGALEFLWEARVALDDLGPGELAAELFTGSGREGVPRGLAIGTTSLPRGIGTHPIAVRPEPGAERPRHLAVWLGAARAAAGEERP